MRPCNRRTGTRLVAAMMLLGVTAPAQASDGAPAASAPAPTPTLCDTLAAHPDDPDRIAPGVPQSRVDLPRAIAACQAAVAADPANGRLNYQLARTLGYAGRGAEALPYRAAAVDAGYPQALFVVGFITLFGLNHQPQDNCRAGELIRAAALAGRQAGLVGFPHWALAGRFAGCAVPQDRAEMLGFVQRAKVQAGSDFYQGLLAEALEARLTASD